MKKIIIPVLMLMATFQSIAETTIKQDGKTFIATSSKSKTETIKTDYTYQHTDGKLYTIYLSGNGRAYILRTSAKSGREYKMYLSEDISRTICKNLKVEYKPKKS